uniref:LEM domain-containing protein n=1 Tax=Globodera rostochiensis TaxID=31243 RepID=A0A914I877_GLORO
MIFAREPFLLHLLAGSDTITALDAAKALLDAGTHDADEREPFDNLTPLHVAAGWGNLAMCQLLIHYGADVKAEDIDKRRPVDVTAEGPCRRFLKRLGRKRRKERSKFGKVLAFLFRCAHPTAVAAAAIDGNEPSLLVVTPEELANERKLRNSCPSHIPHAQHFKSKISGVLAPPPHHFAHPQTATIKPSEALTPYQRRPMPSAPPRRSSSLAREEFLTEDNTRTSDELNVARLDMRRTQNNDENVDEVAVEAEKDGNSTEDEHAQMLENGHDEASEQQWDALRNQFSALRLDELRERLRFRNCRAGPLNVGNRRIYEAKLARLETRKHQQQQRDPNAINHYSQALQRMLIAEEWCNVAESERIGRKEETQIRDEYAHSQPTKKEVAFFCYLLIDPSILRSSAAASPSSEVVPPLRRFLSAIFYASKCRDFATAKPSEQSEKLKRILTLWDRGEGVISQQLFCNIHSAEAHVREGAMIDAIGVDNLTNIVRGSFPGLAARWSRTQIADMSVPTCVVLYFNRTNNAMYSGSWQQQQHTSRSSTTPYHYRLSNSSGFSARSPSSVNDSKSAKRKRLSIASRDGDETSDLQERLCAVVARSQLFGLKSEEGVARSKNEPALITNTTLEPSSSSPPIPVSFPLLDTEPANALLPPYDLLTAATLSPDVQRRKFFADLHPLDRILARIVRPGVAVLHVELVCMLSRFRRTLLAFTKGRLVPVPFDRTKRFYNVNDYISTTVVSIAPSSEELELEIDENEAILTQQGIPAYCRDFDPTTFEDSAHILSLRDNPNLAAQLGIPFNSAHSGLAALHAKLLHLAPTAQRLRTEQTAKLAMAHQFRSAVRTWPHTMCFNKALSVDERCADAYVGRGAACAGCRNFSAALLDLEKAIQLQPDHRNANKYRLEVLHTFAKELERDGKLSDAQAKFGQLLALCPGHQGALEGMTRDDSDQDDGDGHVHDRTKQGVNHHDDDDERRVRKTQNGCAKGGGRGGGKRRETMSEEEVQKNRQKLAEMEAFIATLKGGGGGGGGKR